MPNKQTGSHPFMNISGEERISELCITPTIPAARHIHHLINPNRFENWMHGEDIRHNFRYFIDLKRYKISHKCYRTIGFLFEFTFPHAVQVEHQYPFPLRRVASVTIFFLCQYTVYSYIGLKVEHPASTQQLWQK